MTYLQVYKRKTSAEITRFEQAGLTSTKPNICTWPEDLVGDHLSINDGIIAKEQEIKFLGLKIPQKRIETKLLLRLINCKAGVLGKNFIKKSFLNFNKTTAKFLSNSS